MSTSKIPKKYGNALFTLDSFDLKAAQESGLLRSDLIVDTADPVSSSYGYTYDRQDNIGTDMFGTQMAIQARCKAFGLHKDEKWKVNVANFSHNHAKHIGSSRPPCAEDSIPLSDKTMRNTMQDMKVIESMVELEMVPAHAGSVLSMTAKTLGTFLKSKGIVTSASAISRLKQSIDDKLHGDRAESY